jgi:hypothetical protein
MNSGKTFLSAIFLLLVSSTGLAQLVAFSGKNSNPDDNFAFVALDNIPNGTVIYFTNREYDNATGSFLADGEGTLKFTATTDITMGQVIEIVEPSASGNTFTVSSSGTATFIAGSDWSPTSADPHYAFAASTDISPETNVTDIYAYMDTRSGVHAGGASDPRTGANAYPTAIVCDWTASQAVSIDYNLDRTQASIQFLDDCDSSTYLEDSLTPISLQNFTFDIIFIDGFDD